MVLEVPVQVQVAPLLWASGEYTSWWETCGRANHSPHKPGSREGEEETQILQSLRRHIPKDLRMYHKAPPLKVYPPADNAPWGQAFKAWTFDGTCNQTTAKKKTRRLTVTPIQDHRGNPRQRIMAEKN
jgi:hypothetical protein